MSTARAAPPVSSARRVNAHHLPDAHAPPPLSALDNSFDPLQVSAAHWSDEPWEPSAIRAAQSRHVMATWGAGSAASALPLMVRGEGVYLYDANGQRYLDWTSQAVCANLGHTVPPSVRQAVASQLETLPFVYSGLGMSEVRCRLAQLLSEILPADLTGVLFPCGGAEANEVALRLARRFTGRPKILAHYRSYHGGTSGALAATGDFRRWFGDGGAASGIVHVHSPLPYLFEWAGDEAEAARVALAALEETILAEGPHTIAGLLIESIVGSGGVLIHPRGYVQGARALCDKYGILYIADEVMVGFGRTGTLWGFQQYEGVVPDIVTSAKGLSGAYMPLACVAVHERIRDWFDSHPLGWGATYHAHPVALACSYEVVKHMLRTEVVQHVRALEPTMIAQVQRLVDAHPSVRQARAIGLFGCLDLAGADGRPLQRLQGPPAPEAAVLKAAMQAEGLVGLFRPPHLHCAPPLVITEPELLDGFNRLDLALTVLDRHIGL